MDRKMCVGEEATEVTHRYLNQECTYTMYTMEPLYQDTRELRTPL